MLSDADIAYITADFVPLREACEQASEEFALARRRIAARKLPAPTYVLDDGTEMVPPDYFALAAAAGPRDLRAEFRRRYESAAKRQGVEVAADDVAAEWDGYLSGEYGACLQEVTPENIFAKGWRTERIEELLAEPSVDDPGWLHRLAAHVDALDRLERPFAPCDRVRWGPVSRDRLITAVRERYPQAFVGQGPGQPIR